MGTVELMALTAQNAHILLDQLPHQSAQVASAAVAMAEVIPHEMAKLHRIMDQAAEEAEDI